MVELYSISINLAAILVFQIANNELAAAELDQICEIGYRNQLLVDDRETFLADSESGAVWLFDKCSHDSVLVEPHF